MKEKIRSLAVKVSSEKDLEKSVLDIGLSHLESLREIILVIGHEEMLPESKYPDRIRFSEQKQSLWRPTAAGTVEPVL